MSDIKQRILERLTEEFHGPVGGYIDKQNAKGKSTYGHTLEECPPNKYDWKDMIIEELIDGLQYTHKRAMNAEERAERAEMELIELTTLFNSERLEWRKKGAK